MEPSPPPDEPEPPSGSSTEALESDITDSQQEDNEKPAASRSLQFGSPLLTSTPKTTRNQNKYGFRGTSEPKRTRSSWRGVTSVGATSSPTNSPAKKKPKRKTGKHSKMDWTDAEVKALIEYIAMPSEYFTWTGKWPSMPEESPYWTEAVRHISSECGTEPRSNGSVRTKSSKSLHDQFPSVKGGIDAAEKAYGLDVAHYLGEQSNGISTISAASTSTSAMPSTPELQRSRERLMSRPKLKSVETQTQTDQMSSGSPVSLLDTCGDKLDTDTLEQMANKIFLKLAQRKGVSSNPGNFASLASKAMVLLEEAGKPNVVYNFAKCLATEREETAEPLMPIDRMPFGLLEYQIEFFATPLVSKEIKTPPDYRHWLQMMASEFGQRFFKLFRGPMWSGFDENSPQMRNPCEARVNVACIGYGEITKDIANSKFSTGPEIQEEALRQLKKANPNGKFWIKVDGTDIKPALQESRRREWNGDIDLLDGKLQKLRLEYLKRRGLASSNHVNVVKMRESLEEDKTFLEKKLQKSLKDYKAKLKSRGTSTEKLKELNWNIIEMSQLIEQSNKFQAVYTTDRQDVHLLHKGHEEEHLDYLRFLYNKKRQAATHVLVLMVSDELRRIKPYALPVQYIPYHSLTDMQVKGFVDQLKNKMAEFDLKCVGTVTDGEFSSMRTKGRERPIHVVDVISDVRNKVQKWGQTKLLDMITKTGENVDGSPVTKVPSSIPPEVINKFHRLCQEGNSKHGAATIIRGDLAPQGHHISPWREHCPETLEDTLKTITAVYMYRERLAELSRDGADFLHHLYVPEDDLAHKAKDDQREDHNHLLKRVATHTREGKFGKICVSRFDEAMRCPATRLSQPALTGTRKQCVGDAEKLLSYRVARFFRKKGYTAETEYVQTIHDWHEATDGRGMSQARRKKANENMLNYLLKDWTPWWSEQCDLSDIDFNRPLDSICGFSRQTFIGITSNIESQEMRRRMGGEPEHPRSSTTDDVECFFSCGHRKCHGQNPTLKEWKIMWRKLIWEFSNRLDSNLPFWYWTLNERYHLTEASFDEETEEVPRLYRAKTRLREDSSIMAPGRAFLPSSHRQRTRERFWKFELVLPTIPENMQAEIQQLISRHDDE